MDARLRSWAMTGEYSNEMLVGDDGPGAVADHRSGWGERAAAAALVPVGIAVGVLLAAAVIVRLLILPLGLLSRPGHRD